MRNLDKLKPFLKLYNEGRIIYKDGSLYRTSNFHAGRNSGGRWEKWVELDEPELMRMKLSSSKYYRVNTCGQVAYEHIVIYAIHHGIESLEKWESIDHLDNDKLNNKIENLEGVTTRENNRRIIEDNLLKPLRGSDNGASKLTNEDILNIRKLYKHKELNQHELAEKFKISQQHVSDIVNSKSWEHIKS